MDRVETEGIDINAEQEPVSQEQLDNPHKDFKLQRSVPLYSFCNPLDFKIEREAPLPKYLEENYITKPLPTEKDDLLADYKEIPGEGGLVCINKEAMNKQKGVLVEVLR